MSDADLTGLRGGQGEQPSYFDITYPLASATVANGGVLITSTAGDYFGFSLLTTSAGATMRIYDATTGTGKLLDIIIVGSNTSTRVDRITPIKARVGIYCNITNGTGCEGVVIFAPKG